jgi:hypothetical protein
MLYKGAYAAGFLLLDRFSRVLIELLACVSARAQRPRNSFLERAAALNSIAVSCAILSWSIQI